MPNRFEEIAREARQKTNQELDSELARVTVLTDQKLERLLPTKGDKERFAQLMGIVKSSTSQNRKVAALKDNIESLAGVVVRVLGAVV